MKSPLYPSLRGSAAVQAVALLFSLIAVGCRPAEEIRTYRIAKPDGSDKRPDAVAPSPEAPPAKPRTGEPSDRMLGAIVPGPDQAWFFKAVGPRDAIDPVADSVKDFLGAVRFEGNQPTWDLPEGWTTKPGGGMRLATLLIPTEAGETEMSVIGLGLQDDWDSLVLDNLNRWRKQLEQPPLAAADLTEATTELADVAEEAVLVDELGWFASGGMTPPFANRPPPASRPPVANRPPAARPPSNGELKQEIPVNWSAGETSAMRKASFVTPGDAKVTAFAFAAAGQMGDKLGNANRWRGEVGLPPVSEEELAEATEAIDLLGEEGSYFEFVGESETTYAAMAVRGELVWFFKLRGPGEAVEAQRDAFRGWLESLSL